MKARSREEAWLLANKYFPTDYMKNDFLSDRAGYPIYETTSSSPEYYNFHISDLNTALELNMGSKTVRIWIDQSLEAKLERDGFIKNWMGVYVKI